MQIETLPLTDLKPAPYNPRVSLKPGMPAYERLARSLAEFDLVQPIVWNRTTGHIVGGHQRLEILKSRGVTSVECVVVELSPEREKALNIALNNENLAGDWDTEKLQDLLAELQSLPDFDVTLTGFSESDLRELLMAPVEASVEEPDEIEPLVRVILEIDPEDWDDIHPQIDELLRQYPTIRPHIRLPNE
ncbi:MAG TPA: ParB N-terminal domain-containing protein [Planctomycetaceae bacterium]|nr:ParB N-terminal domain-containing protein [Planctomycetaceae bacterium]